MDFELAKKFIDDKIENFPNVKDLYELILTHISKLEKDETIIDVDTKFMKVKIRYLIEEIFNGSVHDDKLKFYEGFIFLIFNWNNNTIKDEDIELYCKIGQKFLMSIVLMKRSLNVSKLASAKFNRYRGWLPSVNDVSNKYLDLLLENNNCYFESKKGC